ncbi:MAG TPA: DUF2783 domain-containing protein [Roseococcus sp.]|jgi:hypothetical protein|nr:DUF2783 domain-containing protein [Roseococcus sp.]
MKLHRAPRLADPDGFYQALMDAHRGLDAAASRRLDAKLVLLLANHVGDAGVLAEALAIARGGEAGETPAAPVTRLPS